MFITISLKNNDRDSKLVVAIGICFWAAYSSIKVQKMIEKDTEMSLNNNETFNALLNQKYLLFHRIM